MEDFLTAMGFDLEKFKRRNAAEVLNNLLLRAVPDTEESRILYNVLQQGIRKLNERPQPIGYIESVFKTRFGTPRQPLLVEGAKATLKINPKLQPELSLQGLEGFSHVWVVFQFHENTNKIFRPKIHPPRLEGATIGVFATRSPHRPNSIGLSLCRLDRIENGTIYLSGVDLIDGTPVLDIKPYLKYVESQPNATEGWVESSSQVLCQWNLNLILTTRLKP